jgi:CRP-like cAMP-binding protein
MSDEGVPIDVLKMLPIFEGMTDRERQQLVDIASTLEFKPGEVALRQGKRSQNLMVVLEGKCNVMRQIDGGAPKEVLLAELEPYSHFGEMSFFSDAPHSASVRAATPLKLLRFERRDYDLLVAEGNLAAYKLAYNLIDEIADRLRKMDVWVSQLVDNKLDERQVSEWSTFRDKLFSG